MKRKLRRIAVLMVYKKLSIQITTTLLLLTIANHAWTHVNQEIIDSLGWVSDYNANLCHGYYSEPELLKQTPIPPAFESVPTEISFQGPGEIQTQGKSTISQNVIITQPGRIAKADKATIYRDPTTGRILYAELEGNVQVLEHGKLVAGPYAILRMDAHTLEAGPTAYHFYEDPLKVHLGTTSQAYDAWGTAAHSFRDASGLLTLTHASYTTCAPTDPTWQITAGTIVLDKKEGFGTAHNMMLKFYDIPVLYVPIYTFPIDDRRKTGFLTPDISYEKRNGFQMALPFYWNLAPNYDLLTVPKYVENRNFQLNNLFRYLISPNNDGRVYLSIVPHDPAFAQFRTDTLNNPGTPPPGVSLTPYLQDLRGNSDFRGFLNLHENAQFDPQWSGHLELNYVTDDYYFRDFGTAYTDVVANQLLNQADVEFRDSHWSFIGLVQGYQTLHLIKQAGNPAFDQYTRIPELDLNGDYADFWQGLNFSLGAQSVNFAYDSQFVPTTLELPVGERLHLRPTISRPFSSTMGYITPQISLDSTTYASQLAAPENESRQQFTASRNLPIATVDSGMYFERPIHWNNYSYLATLEPRLFYLYVPYVNQDKYPNFDSELLPFTFPQLFDVNRFTSFDRLENANQFSFGLTSRFLNSNTTEQKMKLDMGFGYYLQSPKICLDPNDCDNSTFRYIDPNTHVTPLVAQLTYYPWQDISTSASYAYDLSLGQTNNGQISIDYNHNHAYIFTIKYLFVREQNGDPVDQYGFSNNTHLISSGFALPLSSHWSGLAYGQYNISQERPDSYYGGLQYDSCCWTFRAIVSRSFDGRDTNSKGEPVNLFKNAYYMQLQLKSLGNFGSSPSSLLNNTLSGYSDLFK